MPLVPVYSFEELNVILSAGSNAVTNAYQQFRLVFPGRSMMEIGLTDIFLTQAQTLSSAYGKDAFFEWSNNENITGCDFVVKVNKNQTTNKHDVLCQAKVAKTVGDDSYADFFYESGKTIGRVKVLDYQNILLADYAKITKSEAYYVIYDVKGVSWVNAIALKDWFDTNPRGKMPMVDYCVKAFKALAKPSYLDARAML